MPPGDRLISLPIKETIQTSLILDADIIDLPKRERKRMGKAIQILTTSPFLIMSNRTFPHPA